MERTICPTQHSDKGSDASTDGVVPKLLTASCQIHCTDEDIKSSAYVPKRRGARSSVITRACPLYHRVYVGHGKNRALAMASPPSDYQITAGSGVEML